MPHAIEELWKLLYRTHYETSGYGPDEPSNVDDERKELIQKLVDKILNDETLPATVEITAGARQGGAATKDTDEALTALFILLVKKEDQSKDKKPTDTQFWTEQKLKIAATYDKFKKVGKDKKEPASHTEPATTNPTPTVNPPKRRGWGFRR